MKKSNFLEMCDRHLPEYYGSICMIKLRIGKYKGYSLVVEIPEALLFTVLGLFATHTLIN